VSVIIYLDQNKWIELARMVNRKDESARAKHVVRDFDAIAERGDVFFPLSGIHYMETARISNAARRSRLGAVMWQYSKGATIAGYPTVVRHELEVALSKRFVQVVPRALTLLGRGSSHAFGMPPMQGLLAHFEEDVERTMLVGSKALNIDPPSFRSSKHQENFRGHLASLHSRREDMPKHLWENWLYAILVADIVEPLSETFQNFGLPPEALQSLGEDGLKKLVGDMPMRCVDLHLHKQVLKNPNYLAKITDLEDWAGLVLASCYCDVVVCEKHMADMLSRDGHKTQARIETDLAKTLVLIGDT
jgi:hypothetical protein